MPGSGSTSGITWWPLSFSCSMSSFCSSIPGPWRSGVSGAGAWSGAAGRTIAPVTAAVAGIPHEFRDLVFVEILVFIAILAAAFAYAWRKGVFEWR